MRLARFRPAPLLRLSHEVAATRARLDDLAVLQAETLVRRIKDGAVKSLHDAEFKVFSQFGDDGIVQYVLHEVGVEPQLREFVEFGVGDYTEANTRFLLVRDNWRGLVLEGNAADVARIRADPISWRHDLRAVNAFVDRDNINELLTAQGYTGEIGLLSIDIDGNDYWVWEALECISPLVVICEYNSVFGDRHAVTIPYDPAFVRTRAHHSNLYWGSSLKALCLLAERKGYALVGSNSAGNNAHFVRKDRLGRLRPLAVEEGYVESRVRESRDHDGRLTFLSGAARLAEIGEMSVHDVETGRQVKLRELVAGRG